jgi:hypothetical protein
VSGVAEGFAEWLESLDDEALRSYRFELYTRSEIAPGDSDVYRFSQRALEVVYAVERRRGVQHGLRMLCKVVAPEADADAFTDAMFALARAARETGSDDPASVFAGAFEVARRRAGQPEISNGKDVDDDDE